MAKREKVSDKIDKMLATNVTKIIGRTLEIWANFGSAAVSKNPRALKPDVKKFHYTTKQLYVGICV